MGRSVLFVPLYGIAYAIILRKDHEIRNRRRKSGKNGMSLAYWYDVIDTIQKLQRRNFKRLETISHKGMANLGTK